MFRYRRNSPTLNRLQYFLALFIIRLSKFQMFPKNKLLDIYIKCLSKTDLKRCFASKNLVRIEGREIKINHGGHNV